jgi:hypothetical protein
MGTWVFYRDIAGRWHWDHRDEVSMATVAASEQAFDDQRACLDDATGHGYRHGADRASFPVEFEAIATEAGEVRRKLG